MDPYAQLSKELEELAREIRSLYEEKQKAPEAAKSDLQVRIEDLKKEQADRDLRMVQLEGLCRAERGEIQNVKNASESSMDYPRLYSTASVQAKHANFRDLQMGEHPLSPFYLCGRPVAARGMPIALAEGMYGEFMDDITNGLLDSDAVHTAKLVIGVLTQTWDEEDGLRDAVDDILGDYLGKAGEDIGELGGFKPLGAWQSETDGTMCFCKSMVNALWQETKLGISSTSQDISAKLLNYFQLYVEEKDLQEIFSFPAFGLEIMGDSIRVSGIYIGGQDLNHRVCFEPLTEFVTCHDISKSQPKRMHGLASILFALKRGVEKAKNFQQEFFFERDSQKDYMAQFPHNLRDKYRNLEWLESTQKYPGNRRLVLKMDMAQHGVVLAKYVDQGYREDLHKQLADLEVVPQIREVQVLPGGFKCIMMDYLAPSDGWLEALSSDIPFDELEPAILDTIHRMHRQGIVHSDLRPPNILVRKRHEKLEVRIVDLDSIGEDGACKFPFFLNPEIQWPQEVRGGEAVTKGLDVKIFRRTFKAEQARRQGGQKAYLPVRAMYSPDISQNMLQTRPILFCR